MSALPRPPGEMTPGIDLGATLRAAIAGLVRQWWLVALAVALFLALGILHLASTAPRYTAGAAIVVDPRGGAEEPAAPTFLISDSIIESEVVVLTSRELTNRVVDRLGLVERAAPAEPGALPGLLDALKERLSALLASVPGRPPEAPAPPLDASTEAELAREAVRRALVRAIEVTRTPDTFVITARYTDEDPVLAARVVNTLIEEYFLIEAEAAYQNTSRVTEWLSSRVELLAEAVAQADAAVEAYRRENDLVGLREGVLPVNAEFIAANEELIRTRNEIVDLTAEIDKLRGAIDSGSFDAIDRTGASPVLSELEARLVELIERERELTARLGPGHALVAEARANLTRTRQLIAEELEKLAQRLESRRDTLSLQADGTAERIETLAATAAEDAQKSIRLRELQREADSQRRLYETMLERFNETAQAQTFEPSPARIIARAVPPDTPSAPRAAVILAVSLFGGLVLGSGLAFLREALDDVVRHGDALSEEIGVPVLGLAPLIASDQRMLRARARRAGPPSRTAAPGLTRLGQRMRFAADHEASMFAETLRALAVRLAALGEPDGGGLVVGVTSVRKGEGKSTLAGSFAAMQAARGQRVAVLDLDGRASAFVRAIRSVPQENLLARLLDDPDALAKVRPTDGLCGVVVLTSDRHIVWSEAASLRQLHALVERLRERFDYVVLDVPPMTGLVDARVAAQVADTMVLAVEWGRTRTERLRRALIANETVRDRLVGLVFTKVRINAYARYNGSSFKEYYAY